MRKKYEYFVNNEKLTRKDFLSKLKNCCYRVVDTQMVGLIGVDFTEFDEKKFNRELRAINNGVIVCFCDAQKTFSRKEVR